MLMREGSSRALRLFTLAGFAGLLALICVLIAVSTAQAAVSISRAELSGTKLRIEGQAAANRTITVNGVAMGTSDSTGAFRIEAPISLASRASLSNRGVGWAPATDASTHHLPSDHGVGAGASPFASQSRATAAVHD
jgi:hypothetical protein